MHEKRHAPRRRGRLSVERGAELGEPVARGPRHRVVPVPDLLDAASERGKRERLGEARRCGAALDAIGAPVELLGAVGEQPPCLLDLCEGQDPAPLAEPPDHVDRTPDLQHTLMGQERGPLG